MKHALRTAILVLFLMPAAVSAAEQNEAGVREAMARWSEVYATATDAAEMLALYHPEAVFFGTGNPAPMATPEEMAPYFQTQFDSYTDRRHEFLETVVRVIDDTATATGIYRFTVTPAGGAPIEVTYRHSYAYVFVDGEWLIIQQHSSQLP